MVAGHVETLKREDAGGTLNARSTSGIYVTFWTLPADVHSDTITWAKGSNNPVPGTLGSLGVYLFQDDAYEKVAEISEVDLFAGVNVVVSRPLVLSLAVGDHIAIAVKQEGASSAGFAGANLSSSLAAVQPVLAGALMGETDLPTSFTTADLDQPENNITGRMWFRIDGDVSWPDAPAPAPSIGWPTVHDCADRLGVDPADASDMRSLEASLAATTAMVLKARPDLDPAQPIEADAWQGIVILACLDYRAASTPSGFTGYDGGLPGGDAAERFRAQQLLRINRWAPPRVG